MQSVIKPRSVLTRKRGSKRRLSKVFYGYLSTLGNESACVQLSVNSYNLLMKEFPMDALLGATELTGVARALKIIYSHLKKLKNTAYPLMRGMMLVEAISRDLNAQLLKVGCVCRDGLSVDEVLRCRFWGRSGLCICHSRSSCASWRTQRRPSPLGMSTSLDTRSCCAKLLVCDEIRRSSAFRFG